MNSFLTVLLLILKILGLVLASVLGLVLLVLLILLFVPIRYQGAGCYRENEVSFQARVTFLLHILSVSFTLKDPEPLKIRIFGIRLGKKKEKKKKAIPEPISEPISEPITVQKKEASEIQETSGETLEDQKAPEEAPKETQDEPGDKKEKPKKEKKEKKKKDSKEPGLYDKIKKYLEILQKEEVKKSISLIKKKLIRILKVLLPRKWNLSGRLGFDDPSVTGKAAAVIGILYPITYRHMDLACDFEETVIDIEGSFKGRIHLITILVIALEVILNKNIRKTIHYFKEA